MTSSNFNGGVYQTLSLTNGAQYTLSIKTRDVGSTASAAWCEILITPTQPVNGTDVTTTVLQKWDTWTCDNWNGTNGCVTNTTTFTASASTMYLVLKCGQTNTNVVDISFDNVSVCGSSAPTNTPTNTPIPPTSTPTRTPTRTPTPTNTPTKTPTFTPTKTPTPTNTPACSERVSNGNFSSGSASWTNWTQRGSATRNFSSTSIPTGGTSPCLQINSTSFNGGVYQTLALVNGQQYSLAIKTRDVGSAASAAWCEVLVTATQPVDGQDVTTSVIQKWDTWTCDNWNGTNGCVTNLSNFTASASTMYLVLKCGQSGSSAVNVSYDNVSVCGPAPAPTNTPTNTPLPTSTPTFTNTPLSTPVVTNPSFESDTSGWTMWRGGILSNTDPFERDYQAANGSWCLAIKGIQSDGKGAYQFIQNGWIAGHLYRITARAKNLNYTGLNYSVGWVFGNLGEMAGRSANYGNTVVHPSSWTDCTVEFIYNSTAGVTVYLKVVNDGNSERAGFDYITITDLGTSSATPTPQAGLAISNVQTSGTSVNRYDIWTVDFDLSRSYYNPYDERIIDASLAFTGPSAVEKIIPAYWTGGTRKWRARIAPMETGSYTVQLRARDIENRYTTFNVTGFTSNSSSNKGFIRRDARNNFHLIYDNGTPYYPLGHNTCWTIDNSTHYGYLTNMYNNNENWTRFWMQGFGMNPEANTGEGEPENMGIGRYSQACSVHYDNTLADCKNKSIAVQMCADSFTHWNHDTFAAWNVNPYNSTLGGPCAAPINLFSNAEAIRLTKQRYRYIVSRWGAFTSVLCWELFNEIDALGSGGPYEYTYQPNRNLAATWHQDIALYIKAIDPFDHLVTTSHVNPWNEDLYPEIWNLSGMDIVQLHRYSNDIPKSHDTMLRLARAFNKPIIFGEAGFDSTGPNGVGAAVHGGAWGGAVAESGMMSWWWEDVHQQNLYPNYKAVATFMSGEDMAPKAMSPCTVTYLSGHDEYDAKFHGSVGTQYAYLWIRNLTGGTLAGLRFDLPQMTANNVTAKYYETGSGTLTYTQNVTRSGGVLEFIVPSFGNDIAVKIVPQ